MITSSLKLNPEEILNRLKDVTPEESLSISRALGTKATGQDKPLVIAVPQSEEEISGIMRAAWENDWTVLPIGSGTHLDVGDIPDTIDVAVSTEKLNKIVEYSPENMVVTVQAGIPFEILNQELHENGQMLPLDPVCSEASTIGGITAIAASGPLLVHYGTLRDMTIGTRVVYPDGRRIRTGGKVVKNVAGYDMTKLFVGSHGTLAIITEISFKLRPLPLYQSLVVASGSADESEEFIRRIIHSHLVPSRVEAMGGPYPFLNSEDQKWHIAVDCHEPPLAAKFQVSTVHSIADELGMLVKTYEEDMVQDIWNDYRRYLEPYMFVVRYSVEPKRMMRTSEQIRETVSGYGGTTAFSVSVPRGVGRIYISELREELEAKVVGAVRSVVEQQGGIAVIERGSQTLRAKLDSFGISRSDFRLMQGIKNTVDPKRILNPGRLRGVETWHKSNLK